MGNPNPVKKFKKGQSGNPKGRPLKKYSFTHAIYEVMNKAVKIRDPKTNRLHKKYPIELLQERVVKLLLQGDTAMIKMLWEQIDGKATFKIEQVGDIDFGMDAKNKEELKHIEKTLNYIAKYMKKKNK